MSKLYTLSYTRDRQIITQHAWQHAHEFGLKKLVPLESDFGHPIIFYVNKGAIEIWEQQQAIDYIYDQILKQNSNDPKYITNIVDKLLTFQEAKLASLWDKQFTNSASVLGEFCDDFFKAVSWYVYIWATMIDDRSPKEAKDATNKWRDQDALFENSSQFIVESLKGLHPELGGFYNYITKEELQSPPSKDVLAQRTKNFVSIVGSYAEVESLADFATKHPEYVFKAADFSKDEEVQGTVAYKGFAKGIVRHIRSQFDIDNVQEGEILVSPMTIPEFLPAMKKAAAFVTDEGGITCHAAIVARELKKPCIIGTKIATQVLKDGDEVEVDANEGVVNILKRAQN